MIKKLPEQTHLIVARKRLRIQQEELADRINTRLGVLGSIRRFTWNTISKYENGWKKTIRKEEAKAYAEELRIKVSEIELGGINVR